MSQDYKNHLLADFWDNEKYKSKRHEQREKAIKRKNIIKGKKSGKKTVSFDESVLCTSYTPEEARPDDWRLMKRDMDRLCRKMQILLDPVFNMKKQQQK